MNLAVDSLTFLTHGGQKSPSAVGEKNVKDQSLPLPLLFLFSFGDMCTADRNQQFLAQKCKYLIGN